MDAAGIESLAAVGRQRGAALTLALRLPRVRLEVLEAVGHLDDALSAQPIRKAAETIRRHIENILTYYQHPVTNS